MKKLIILTSALFLTGCFDNGDVQAKVEDSVQLGKATFEKNCASCHGKDGEGIVKDWKKRQADGNYPAPPVNGSAHAWHHSPKTLLSTINNGGAKLGGRMPAFKDKLSEEEKLATLDYIHSLWPEEIQKKYDSRFK
ncbi:c-type cytochrome [Candidatus Thioglobus sp.]|nr:c-type cytochrome [Candidatus Thioglobus sp.]MDB3893115.1 c-type cytochrome [Candidatus Thioglobus sp.]MDB9829053.1 c-type cytochrome [Candidatus Thioglobus sp.]MDC0388629.1 c-type cytochrome [Candidatus Thioglobus sp.]MDC0903844.1 cytochrome c [Candidatus Thioglobus sp.]